MPDCTYTTEDVTEAVAIALLNAHMHSHTQSSKVKRGGPKLDRPVIEAGASMEEWNLFTRKWRIVEGNGLFWNNRMHPEGGALISSEPQNGWIPKLTRIFLLTLAACLTLS